MKFIDNIYNPPEPRKDGRSDDEGRDAKHGSAAIVWDVVTHHTWELIKLNVLVFVTCLPIVTIPMAAAAATSLFRDMIGGRVVFVWHDYFKAWGAYWKRASVIGLPILAVSLLGAFGAWFYSSSTVVPGLGGVAFAGLCGAAALVALAMMIYLFPMLVVTDLSRQEIWRNSLLLVPLRFPSTLLTFLFDLLIVAVGVLLLPYSFFVLPLFGLSLIGLAGTQSALKGIAQFVTR
ncbi:YesL family protein [Bifidobacterium avesanii]|uniref:DUF624 domain-containing protein n=1 Tax=Bifidobacterium avesanii TaxID=1798157 RepID=A0A7K3TIQ7_9BIFI|nr:YesL family protein [Bifidobacterium avesanii]KAB8290339.1 hypothetical protein DSM100685_1471 [Bifidobacterium avesanii]NEG78987.1 DUF624 domain-containing protein [Bifidobacterium avesanii]